MKQKLFDKVLSRSNQYKFYKNNYKKLKSENNKLKKRNNGLKLNNIDLKKQLSFDSKKKIYNKLIEGDYSNINISIKTPNPKGHHHWGDYFYALALKKSFEKKGFNVVIHEKEDWYGNKNKDIVIVLRGLKKYNVNYDSINVMWYISHPDMMALDEYES